MSLSDEGVHKKALEEAARRVLAKVHVECQDSMLRRGFRIARLWFGVWGCGFGVWRSLGFVFAAGWWPAAMRQTRALRMMMMMRLKLRADTGVHRQPEVRRRLVPDVEAPGRGGQPVLCAAYNIELHAALPPAFTCLTPACKPSFKAKPL